MTNFIVTIEFVGLTGTYRSRVEVRARNVQSARRKVSLTIGNRDGTIISVITAASASEA